MRSTRRHRALALTVLALVITQGTSVVSAATPNCGTWRPVWSPNPAGTNFEHYLEAVAGLSSTTAIAVGYRAPRNDESSASRPLAEVWNGSAWRAVTVADPGMPSGFTDVTRIARRSAWAVGWQTSRGGTYRPLIERYTRGAWSIVPSPTRTVPTWLTGVDAISTTDAWAVGRSIDPERRYENRTFAMHWDGSSWTKVATPNPPGGAVLTAVATRNATDVWSVGYREDPDGGDAVRATVQHWDGTRWSVVPIPRAPGSPRFESLSGVTVRSASDAWAVGSYSTSDGYDRPFTLHWDGRAWKRVTSPAFAIGVASYLVDVTFAPHGSVYAVGGFMSADSSPRPLVVRWDGSRWIRYRISSSFEPKVLNGVGAMTATDVHAVGFRSYDAIGDNGSSFAVRCSP